MRYSVDVFVNGHILNAKTTDNLATAYTALADKLELVECGCVQSVIIFDTEDIIDDDCPKIVASVNRWDI